MPERCLKPAVRSSTGPSGYIGGIGADCARPVRAGRAGRAGAAACWCWTSLSGVGPRLAAICGARGTHGERRWGGSLVKGTDRRSPSSRVRSAPPFRFPRVAPDRPDLRGASKGLIRRATRWFAARWMRRNDALHIVPEREASHGAVVEHWRVGPQPASSTRPTLPGEGARRVISGQAPAPSFKVQGGLAYPFEQRKRVVQRKRAHSQSPHTTLLTRTLSCVDPLCSW